MDLITNLIKNYNSNTENESKPSNNHGEGGLTLTPLRTGLHSLEHLVGSAARRPDVNNVKPETESTLKSDKHEVVGKIKSDQNKTAASAEA